LKALSTFLDASKGGRNSPRLRARCGKTCRGARLPLESRGSSGLPMRAADPSACLRRLRCPACRLDGGSRCSPPSCTTMLCSRAMRCWRGSAGRAMRSPSRPERFPLDVRIRVGKVDAYVICPCSAVDALRARVGCYPEPDHRAAAVAPEGGAKADPLHARRRPLDDPDREHADAAPLGRDDPARAPWLSTRLGDGRPADRLRRRVACRPGRMRTSSLPPLWPLRSRPTQSRSMFDRIAPVYDL